jgi:hypothetical protein
MPAYHIPVTFTNSPYRVRLHYLASRGSSIGTSVFNLSVNSSEANSTTLNGFDPTATVIALGVAQKGWGSPTLDPPNGASWGWVGNWAVVQDMVVTSDSPGMLNLSEASVGSGGPQICGIQIITGN